MTLTDFTSKLIIVDDKKDVRRLISDFINGHSADYKEEEIKSLIDRLQDRNFTSFGNKIGYCKTFCLEEESRESNQDDKEFLEKLKSASNLLNCVSRLYQEKHEARRAEKAKSSQEETLSHQKDVLREINSEIKTFKTEIDNSKTEMKRISESFNDKIFSVLINTVAILGIFVAIAFAGLGVTNIFSSLDFTQAFVSEQNLVKSIFFLLLTAVLSYNLLLLLVYFIYKLSRPLIIRMSKDGKGNDMQETFLKTINLTPFIWVDCIMAALTIATFIACVCIW